MPVLNKLCVAIETSMFKMACESENYRKKLYKGKLQSLKEKSSDLILDSTWHGLPYAISKERPLLKAFWLAAFSISLCTCLYLTISCFVEYFEYKVLVKHSLILDLDYEFPAVTFCNLNPVDYKNNPNFTEKIKAIFYARLDNETRSTVDMNEVICDKTTRLLTNDLIKLNLTPTTAFYSMDQMLLSCHYNDKPCRNEDFVLYRSHMYGNCFTWNSGVDSRGRKVPVKTALSQGLASGLRLELFVGEEQYQPCWIQTTGAIVAVHNQTVDPLIYVEGVKLKTGQESNLAVSRLLVEKLSKPYSDCIQDTNSIDAYDSYWYRKTFEFTRSYRKNYCVSFCTAYKSLESNITSCFTMLNHYTLSGLRECIIAINDMDPFYNHCFHQCPTECSTNVLSTSQHFTDYPTHSSTKFLFDQPIIKSLYSSTPTYEQVKQSTLAVNVYYGNSFYTLIEDEPATDFSTLIANVGGNLALFLGLSVLSLLELVEFVISIVYILSPMVKSHQIDSDTN